MSDNYTLEQQYLIATMTRSYEGTVNLHRFMVGACETKLRAKMCIQICRYSKTEVPAFRLVDRYTNNTVNLNGEESWRKTQKDEHSDFEVIYKPYVGCYFYQNSTNEKGVKLD